MDIYITLDNAGDDEIGNPCGVGNRWRKLLLEVNVGCDIGGETVHAISGQALPKFRWPPFCIMVGGC